MTKKYIISALYIFMLLFFVHLKLEMEESRGRSHRNWIQGIGLSYGENATKNMVSDLMLMVVLANNIKIKRL